MTLKKFQQAKLFITIVIAIVVGQSVVRDNYIIPIVTVVVGMLVLMGLRRRVSEIITDERDYAIGGKAALLAMQAYSWIAVVAMLVLYAMRADNIMFEPIALTLAYSTCVLMFLYAGLFRYLRRAR